MTDKYEEAALKRLEQHRDGFTIQEYNAIKHALANCLPELPLGVYYHRATNITYDDWEVSLWWKQQDGTASTCIGKGKTIRAAAQEAIKKIQGGGE